MKILFLHGWHSVPSGVKPTYLKDHGHEVINPKLDDDDFDAAVRTAQAEYNRHQPNVIVGSSRGGAVALNIDSGDTPLVLLCPAWKRWGTVRIAKEKTAILHSRADDAVPFADSEELVRVSGLPQEALIEVGTDHRLADPEPLQAMLRECEAFIELFSQYHSHVERGRLPFSVTINGDPNPAFLTDAFSDSRLYVRSGRLEVPKSKGGRILLFCGIKSPALPTTMYFLWATFVVDQVIEKESEDENGRWSRFALGQGWMLNPPQLLDTAEFRDFLQKMNIDRNFRRISDHRYSQTLLDIAYEWHRPNVIDDHTITFCQDLSRLIPDEPQAAELLNSVKHRQIGSSI